MKWDVILLSFLVGLSVFTFQWEEQIKQNGEGVKYEALSCFCVYLVMYYHYRRASQQTTDSALKYGSVLWLGTRIALIAAVSAAILFIVTPEPSGFVAETSKAERTFDIFFSTLLMAEVVAVAGSYFIRRRFSY